MYIQNNTQTKMEGMEYSACDFFNTHEPHSLFMNKNRILHWSTYWLTVDTGR